MRYRTILKEKKEVACNTVSFRFKKPEGFNFIPGQYIQLTVLHSNIDDDKGMTRDFSISSAPFEEDITTTTRIRQSALKKSLKSLNTGDEVEIKGPFGKFLLEKGPAVFLVAGIGITAFRSILKQLEYENKNQEITLFYANKTKKSTVFFDELLILDAKIPGFTFIPIFTQEKEWKGEREYISEHMLKKYLADFKKTFYLVGNPEFIDSVIKTLESAKIPSERIRLDYFSGY